ncbi:hypothetical protein H2200_010230 [Cladophialophora chaetospira]|uniref:BSP-domain-containing protein n=1 Tax=Cladophialophora chaetospira TaxID=386627 RepID=A0AA39CEQ3_9EURO|nr:hypothetical protein H2200_010230 [Cladophialophora chaetospira]
MPAIPPRGDAASSDSRKTSTKHVCEDVPLPLTRLEIRDLSGEGAKLFLHTVDAPSILNNAIKTVHAILTPMRLDTPNVRSITLILRDFAGVAYTTGKDIDFEHKEIHFSTEYIESIDPERLKDEITGVLVHEMVHVWQWNGEHSCNGGLIEGIADWVRLKAGLAPPHWRKRCEGCEWDAGYDVTGFFLASLEGEFGKDVVVRMNQQLRHRYVEEEFWREISGGKDVKILWDKYTLSQSEQENRDREEEQRDGEEKQENGEKNQDADRKLPFRKPESPIGSSKDDSPA